MGVNPVWSGTQHSGKTLMARKNWRHRAQALQVGSWYRQYAVQMRLSPLRGRSFRRRRRMSQKWLVAAHRHLRRGAHISKGPQRYRGVDTSNQTVLRIHSLLRCTPVMCVCVYVCTYTHMYTSNIAPSAAYHLPVGAGIFI